MIKISNFEIIKNLLDSDEWPEAVLEFQIADDTSEEEKLDRAEGIVDILVDETLENKKFLDFGCGEGHTCKYTSEQTHISAGYDITPSGNLKWEDKIQGYILTNDFKKIIEAGPFDIILIYDVLDHAEDPVGVLKKAKSVLSDNGKIYLRCHPWCGRHGGHMYREINKAFVHLIIQKEELEQLNKINIKNNFQNKITYPIKTYIDIIEKSNLKIEKQEIETQEIEDFFKNNELIRNRILKNWNLSKWSTGCPEFQMQQCFIDYVLIK
jgi:2-polyprenyl-3-methyl-5-hydroxy-6-metoxy-1,4-benzoquinol methylase